MQSEEGVTNFHVLNCRRWCGVYGAHLPAPGWWGRRGVVEESIVHTVNMSAVVNILALYDRYMVQSTHENRGGRAQLTELHTTSRVSAMPGFGATEASTPTRTFPLAVRVDCFTSFRLCFHFPKIRSNPSPGQSWRRGRWIFINETLMKQFLCNSL